jgi:hypothetical protein
MTSARGGPVHRWPAQWRDLLRSWEVKQRIAIPVIANLSTALALFMVAYIMKPAIVRLFRTPGVAQYPLSCTAEAFNELGSERALVDVFLVNLADREVTAAELRRIVQESAPGAGLSPGIRLTTGSRTRILSVTPDSVFNAGKGEVAIAVLDRDSTTWELNPLTIDATTIMRYAVRTDLIRRIQARGARFSNPVECKSQYRRP